MLAALVLCVAPELVAAAPRHTNGLRINATPNPILAGDGVLIYGQLEGKDVAHQPIRLYHRVNPSPQFTLIGVTRTDQFGFYEFTREEGVVYTNRSWFVRGPIHTHSRTIQERVEALVSLNADRTTADTRQPILFFGHVTPNHAFERVFLQEQMRASDEWRTLSSTTLGPGSNYAIEHRWRFPGLHVVRVLLRRDARNISSASDTLTVTIQQAQVPDFTISSTPPVVDIGQSAMISGKLYGRGTNKPEPETAVTLCGRPTDQQQFTCDTAGVTGMDGSYSFMVSPVHNEVYVVKSTLRPHRHTARLLEGVRDTVTLTANQTFVKAGQPVTPSGSAMPDKAGDVIYLERLGADGDWHIVGVHTMRPNSTFQFVRVFGTAGPKQFRARIPGDPENIGGASLPVTVTVTVPPPSLLPAASRQP